MHAAEKGTFPGKFIPLYLEKTPPRSTFSESKDDFVCYNEEFVITRALCVRVTTKPTTEDFCEQQCLYDGW